MRDVVANFIRDTQPITPLLAGARAPEWYLVRRSLGRVRVCLASCSVSPARIDTLPALEQFLPEDGWG